VDYVTKLYIKLVNFVDSHVLSKLQFRLLLKVSFNVAYNGLFMQK
jgi:hypothetical protein